MPGSSVVGRAKRRRYNLPLTQRELSECLGLTVVHANRTLQELRRRGLVEFENRQLTVLDRRGLEGVAEFDPAYLYLERRARASSRRCSRPSRRSAEDLVDRPGDDARHVVAVQAGDARDERVGRGRRWS